MKNDSLKEDDTIDIPYYNREVYLLGEVKNPGPISYTPEMNLLQTLTRGGGLIWRGDATDILMMRPIGESTEYIEVNIQDMIDRKAQNPLLEPGDTVMVGGRVSFDSPISYFLDYSTPSSLCPVKLRSDTRCLSSLYPLKG